MNTYLTQAHRADLLIASIPLMDMRKSARVYGSFPVRMRGLDESGCEFQASSLVDNISAGGLYLQTGHRVREGSRMFVLVQFVTGAIIAARGAVVRVERLPHGLTGVAMSFRCTRLLPSQGAGAPSSSAGPE